MVNSSGTVLQSTDYYPFGLAFSDENVTNNRYLYNGKELEDYTIGSSYLGALDYGARHYDARIARWTVPDPMAEKYYGVSAYVYCADNPVLLMDIDGKRTFVHDLGDGKYQVVGGKLDFNNKIYVVNADNTYKLDDKGNRITIGRSLTKYSFFNSDKHMWATDAIINMNDQSGIEFVSSMTNELFHLGDYMEGAKKGNDYDFKNSTNNMYNGMPFNDAGIIASARDIGNFVAGYYAGANGFSWAASRIAFDLYQGGIEGVSSQSAQWIGWQHGNSRSPLQQLYEKGKSIPSLFLFVKRNVFDR